MASIRKHRDKWQAQIRLNGTKPIAQSFTKKSDALAWATITESEILRGTYVDQRPAASVLIADLIDRYLEELKIDPAQKRSKASRCKPLRASLGRFSLNKLLPYHLAEYRDQRLLAGSGAMTVIHELSLLHRILTLATTEWGYPIGGSIPRVTLPKRPKGRTRRLDPCEEQHLLHALEDQPVLREIVIVALETAMRRGEISRIRSEHLDVAQSTLLIPETKTGSPREIPLTRCALEVLIQAMRHSEVPFDLKPEEITQRFRKVCLTAAINDLRFHDLRHEATSRLFEKGLSIVEVSAITGHTTLDMLNRYTHLRPQILAAKLKEISAQNA